MDPATITALITVAAKLLDVITKDGDPSKELVDANTLLRREMVKRAKEL